MNHIAEQIDQLATMFADLNIQDLPNYRIMCAFKQALVQAGVPPLLAEQVVANMDINVSERVLTEAPASVYALVDNMALLVYRMYVQIQQDFATDPTVILLSMSRSINLKLEY